MQPTILAHDEMVIGAGEQNITGDGLMAFDNECHSPLRLIGEPLSQPRGKCRIDMLDDDNRGLECCGEMSEDFRQCVGTSCRGPKDDERLERQSRKGPVVSR